MSFGTIKKTGGALLGLLLSILAIAPDPGTAQEFGLPNSAVIVIDANRLFTETEFGKRVARELEIQSAELAAENRRIEAELADEEKALTEERAGMAPAAFRDKADAFDAKVKRIRDEQVAKAEALEDESNTAQRRFLAVAQPVLEQLMADSAASVMLDRRSVLLRDESIDITEEAVRRIDVAIGDGTGIVPPKDVTPEPNQQDQE